MNAENFIIIFLTGILVFIFYSAIDPFAPKSGSVILKWHEEPWTSVVYIKSGNMMIPQTIHHSEKWIVQVEKDGDTGKCYVTKPVYDSVKSGQEFSCE